MPKKISESEFVKTLKMTKPESMDYFVDISTDKAKNKFINRVEKIIRGSTEYRDYIQFLKENVGLDSCIFFQNVTNSGGSKKRISVEMHHEPFTLYDIVEVVLNKFIDEGIPVDDLDIADEVMMLHYENKVGLVPLSKTAHEVIHNSNKLMIPLNMCYGDYSTFLEEYEPYVSEELYVKLEKKIDMTKNLTPESFDAIKKEFTYLEVEGFDEVSKMDLKSDECELEEIA